MTEVNFYGRVEAAKGEPVEVTEDEYWDALEVLPPIYIKGSSCFAVMEAHSHNREGVPVYHCFAVIGNKYYGVLGTLLDARRAFDLINARRHGVQAISREEI